MSLSSPLVTHYCAECETHLPLSDFYVRKSGRKAGKPVGYCKPCSRKRRKEWYDTNLITARGKNRTRAMRSKYDEAYIAQRRDLSLKHRVGKGSWDWVQIILCDPCAYCGEPSEAVDHIDAQSTGGKNEWDNFTPACMSCNASKKARPLLLALAYMNGCYVWQRGGVAA